MSQGEKLDMSLFFTICFFCGFSVDSALAFVIRCLERKRGREDDDADARKFDSSVC